MPFHLAIVIPALNEADCIDACITGLRRQFPAAEVIVVDAGSTDATVEIAKRAGADRVLSASRGRGLQCRAGAAQASGDWLLFLHADTQLQPGMSEAVSVFCGREDARVANFRLTFDEDSGLLRFSAWWTRFDSVFTRFGDQGILIRRTVYETLGGFPAWPLFEDVELLRRARAGGRVPSLVPGVITSARRFRRQGPWRRQFSNAGMVLRFLCGTSPHILAAEYARAQANGRKRAGATHGG